MTTGASKSYKRRRTSSAAPKGAGGGASGSASAAMAASASNAGGASSSSAGGAAAAVAKPSPYASLPTEEALAAIASDASSLVPDALYRLASGLPRSELELMRAEAEECERALKEEIRILEKSIGVTSELTEGDGKADGGEEREKGKNDRDGKDQGGAAASSSVPKVVPALTSTSHFSTVDEILTSELTPPDRFFTVSALLGRLREPLDTPLPPNSSLIPLRESQSGSGPGGWRRGLRKGATDAEKREAERRWRERLLERQRALLDLESNAAYVRTFGAGEAAPLLACWKRISNHRSAAVFRKAVNPREAPGYTERILFPIDLALIRKMISSGHVDSFRKLHRRIGLICHNCVKYNGRESDYGVVTREFELYADDAIIDAVQRIADAEAAAAAKARAAAVKEQQAAASAAAAAAAAAGTAGMGSVKSAAGSAESFSPPTAVGGAEKKGGTTAPAGASTPKARSEASGAAVVAT